MNKAYTHIGSRDNFFKGKNPFEAEVKKNSNELQVNAKTPPTFIYWRRMTKRNFLTIVCGTMKHYSIMGRLQAYIFIRKVIMDGGIVEVINIMPQYFKS